MSLWACANGIWGLQCGQRTGHYYCRMHPLIPVYNTAIKGGKGDFSSMSHGGKGRSDFLMLSLSIQHFWELWSPKHMKSSLHQ